MAEGLDGVELGGLVGGEESEYQSDGYGYAEGGGHHPGFDDHGHALAIFHEDGHAPGEQDAGDASAEAEGDRFDEELDKDVPAASSDRDADADLACALGDGDQHDVHDPYAADDEGNEGNPHEQLSEGLSGGGEHFGEFGLGADVEVVVLPIDQFVAPPQDLFDLQLGGLGVLQTVGAGVDVAHPLTVSR